MIHNFRQWRLRHATEVEWDLDQIDDSLVDQDIASLSSGRIGYYTLDERDFDSSGKQQDPPASEEDCSESSGQEHILPSGGDYDSESSSEKVIRWTMKKKVLGR